MPKTRLDNLYDFLRPFTFPICVLSVVSAVMATNISADRAEKQRFDNLSKIVRKYINTNDDGVVEMSEWAKVYDALAIEFDPKHPRALTSSDLEQFLLKIEMYDRADKRTYKPVVPKVK